MEQWNTPGDFSNPAFDKPDRVHDWLNYVQPELAAIWQTFTEDQKKVIAYNLQYQANMEDWD